MRVVLDLQGCQSDSRFRGIGRYSLSLAKAIIKNKGQHEVFVVLNGMFPDTVDSIRDELDGLILQDQIRVWMAAGPVDWLSGPNTWRRHCAEMIREAFLQQLEPDIVHVSSMFDGYGDNTVCSVDRLDSSYLTFATLYDLIPLINPQTYLDPNPSYKSCYESKIEQIRKVDGLLAISASAGEEANRWLGFPAGRITNIGAAADSIFTPRLLSDIQQAGLKSRFGISDRFVLYTGATDDRKNHIRLIEAFSKLPEPLLHKTQLVIAGGMPQEHHERFVSYGASRGLATDRLVVAGRVTDSELVTLYRSCALFILPSLHEGFGLPALEAMCCGAPVIGSCTTSIPEVIGASEAMFDPQNVEEMSILMARGLTDEKFRQLLLNNASVQSRKFSWDQSAISCWNAFEQLLSTPVGTTRSKVSFGVQYQTDTVLELLEAEPPRHSSVQDWLKTAHALALNQRPGQTRQLLVDVSQLATVDAKTGIQRVVRSLILQLLAHPPSGYVVRLVFAKDDDKGYRYATSLQGAYSAAGAEAGCDGVIDVHQGDIFLGLDLQHHVVISHQPLYLQWRRLGVKVYFVIYDLLPILLPHAFPQGVPELHPKWLDVIAKSDGAVCISRAVADEFVGWLDVCGPKRVRPLHIGWFHLGADLDASMPTKGLPPNGTYVLTQIRLRPTFLMVGTIEPRKGQAQTLAAFERLWARSIDVNLVLVGKSGWNVESLLDIIANKHQERAKRLFWLNGVTDEFLQLLYASSTCLIAASDGEGFGLPLIEAAQYKIPIIARDIPVFREVAGDFATYFKGTDPEALSGSIEHWLRLNASGTTPRSQSMPWLTWSQSVDQLLQNIVHENWYKSWEALHIFRFWPSDVRFGTQSGQRIGRRIVSSGDAGYVLHGPYISLPMGKHRVELTATITRIGHGEMTLDIAVDHGREVRNSIVLTHQTTEPPHKFALSFELLVDAPDVEVRMFAPAGFAMELSLVEFFPVSDENESKV